MIPLSLSCHGCNEAFPSGAYADESLPRSLPIDGLVYECPHCGLRDTYTSAEQTPRFADGTPGPQRSRLGAIGRVKVPTGTFLQSKLWVGVAVGLLSALMSTAVLHAVHAGVVALSF